MALLTGRISKIGSVSSAQPAGRITLLQNEGTGAEAEAQVNCDSSAGSARWDVAITAFELQRPVEIDVLNSNNPFIADKVRVTT